MNPRKDWSWRPDALTRKRIDDGNKKVRDAQKRTAEQTPKRKTGELK